MADIEKELAGIKDHMYRLTKVIGKLNEKIDKALLTPKVGVTATQAAMEEEKKRERKIPKHQHQQYEWKPWPDDWREDR